MLDFNQISKFALNNPDPNSKKIGERVKGLRGDLTRTQLVQMLSGTNIDGDPVTVEMLSVVEIGNASVSLSTVVKDLVISVVR